MNFNELNLSFLKNKKITESLRKFLENLFHKKGQDLIAILLFGSFAKGTAKFTKDYQSDLDLLIISRNLPEGILERKMYTANLSKSLGCGIDELWYTPQEIQDILQSHRAFFLEIIRDGKILFELENFLTRLKAKVEHIIKEKNIKELKYSWVWPQDTPGVEMDW